MLGILSASLVAIYQVEVKRLLAYSSVAQIGYMVLGIGLASTTGITGAILHLFNHALMKGALFLALAAVAYRVGSTTLQDLVGLGRRMPWTMSTIVVGLAKNILGGAPSGAGADSPLVVPQAPPQRLRFLPDPGRSLVWLRRLWARERNRASGSAASHPLDARRAAEYRPFSCSPKLYH